MSHLWERISLLLKKEIGLSAYKNWFDNTDIVVSQEGINIVTPNAFIRDWMTKNYFDLIQRLLKEEINYEQKCSITARENQTRKVISHSERYNFDNFILDTSNQLAHAIFKNVTNQGDTKYNPIFLHGPTGEGKTHLMQALFSHMEMMNYKTAYFTAASFTFNFVNAIHNKEGLEFQKKIRDLDILFLDDMQFIAGKKLTQEEIIHIISHFIHNRKQVVITANQMPNKLTKVVENLRSRLSSGIVIDIQPSSTPLKINFIKYKANLMGIYFTEEASNFMAHNAANIRELEGFLWTVYAHIKQQNTLTVDLAEAKKFLSKKVVSPCLQNGIESVKSAVAQHYGLTVQEIISSSRKSDILEARNIAMYLIHKYINLSLTEVGRYFGNRSHSTVLHALSKIDQAVKREDGQILSVINNLKNSLI